MKQKTFTVNSLSTQTTLDRRTIGKRLADVKPDKVVAGEKRYRLATLDKHLTADDRRRLGAPGAGPDDLTAARARLALARARKIEAEAIRARGDMIPLVDVAAIVQSACNDPIFDSWLRTRIDQLVGLVCGYGPDDEPLRKKEVAENLTHLLGTDADALSRRLRNVRENILRAIREHNPDAEPENPLAQIERWIETLRDRLPAETKRQLLNIARENVK